MFKSTFSANYFNNWFFLDICNLGIIQYSVNICPLRNLLFVHIVINYETCYMQTEVYTALNFIILHNTALHIKKLNNICFPQLKEERTHTGGTESLNVWVRSNNIITQPHFEVFWDFWGILALCGNFLWYFGISKKKFAFWGFFCIFNVFAGTL